MAQIKSEGVCIFCGKTFSKSTITRHLARHLDEQAAKRPGSGRSFHLRIEHSKRWGGGPWFINLWMDGTQTFNDLDRFLRAVWLECCGHLSGFRVASLPGSRQKRGILMPEFELEDWDAPDPGAGFKARTLQEVLQPGMTLEYTYDYGSSTELGIAVIAEIPAAADAGLMLLSRNEPLFEPCAICGTQPASVICSVCVFEGPASFCKDCAKLHRKACTDFADYAKMKLVNSPRAGVCAYDGGTIDKKRDGVYKVPASGSAG